jgi:hypothetical protein
MMSEPSLTPPEPAKDMVRYYDLAHEICVRADHDRGRLSDDERITLSVIAAQAALARYVEPGDRDAAATIDKILRVLDHREMIAAMTRKMHRLIEVSEHRPAKAKRLSIR